MKPELLAPVGSEEALHAAVQAGADAVYLGAGAFNARRTAGQFDGETLRSAVEYAHARGVKVYVTLNTLVREDEFAALKDDVRMVARAKADAVLVQDFGVARCIHRMVPELPLHASTQMAVHNRSGVRFMKAQGFSRVVLAREMLLSEIEECAKEGIELEVFVHGALCVACSGQCLFSSLVGGRSGNRGCCAQPCRRRYTFDGIDSYALSTRDLCAVEDVQALCAAGVSSLKIEGRLKRSEYVATVTKAYRNALDGIGQPDVEALRQMFNRGGFTKGYLPGVRDTALMYGERPNHVGVVVGKAVKKGYVLAEKELRAKDALVLHGADGEDRPVVLTARENESVPCAAAQRGDVLVRLVSDAQMQSARVLFESENRTTPLHAALTLHVGGAAQLTVFDETDSVTVCGEIVQPAQKAPTPIERLEAQLKKTGGTAYCFDNVQIDADANAFFPVSAVNALRRDALRAWFDKHERAPYNVGDYHEESADAPRVSVPEIAVQSADFGVLRRAAACGAQVCYAPDDVRPDALNAALEQLPQSFALALPCVLAEESLLALNRWAQENADRITATRVSNVAHFALSWSGALQADMMLHAANRAAVWQLMEWGCTRITPSIELTAAQIRTLKAPLDLVVHGRIPLMQLRHCPYRAVHGLKGLHESCSRCDACAPDEVVTGRTLTDERGVAFPLRRLATPNGCIVRVLNSVPLMLLRKAAKLPEAASWRLLLDADDPVEDLIELYRAAANGKDARECAQWSAVEKMQTTTGHYFRGVE